VNVLAAGQHIADRYQLDRRIAVGGMGEVWEASDTRLGRSVAVKVLRPELTDDPEFLHRFRIEARTVASLDHAGIAGVHDYGEDEGAGGRRTAWLVMELVRGEPLSTLIARGPIDAEETLRIVEEAAWALQAAHERGYVHRDVKPGNILVRNDGMVKLTDFGIAKAADAVPVTRSGMVMGTAHYIAPEQASGAEAGPAGDVYSLGIVGYECLAGHRPFRAESAVAVAMMQVRDEPPPLPPTVPMHARELIEAVLVKDPTRRYSTGGEFAAAVAAVRRGESLPPPGSLSGPFTPTRTRAVPTPTLPPTPVMKLTTPPAPAVKREVPVSTAAPRRVGRPIASAPARPLELRAGTGRGRTLMLILFVLLTVAAVVVGIYVFRSLGAGATPQGMTPGTVNDRPVASLIDPGGVQ
jgi:serine/threonine-protein kinase